MSNETIGHQDRQGKAKRGGDSADSIARDKSAGMLVVGIGASAGGLESIERFFQNVDDKSGAAFVVIQHLLPDFKSFMPEILAAKTRLQIRIAADQMSIEPDTIYLVPPQTSLIIEDQVLYLSAVAASRVPSKPIDVFFESLANDCGQQAIAVVLSGTGSDGADGIEKIHGAGGRVFVESTVSAKFDGMPGAALSRQVHDAEGTPFELAETIFGKGANDFGRSAAMLESALSGNSELVNVFRAIENHYGLDFSCYRIAPASRQVDQRMQKLGFDSIDQYWLYIQDNPTEVALLFQSLFNFSNRMFADSDAYSLVKKEVSRVIDEKEPGEEVRVWSAGCGSGQEPYSLAMLFAEEIQLSGKRLHLKVFATDIDDQTLGQAGSGMFSKECLHDVPDRYRTNNFIEQDGGYNVSAELRAHVVFAHHNVMNSPPFGQLDMIACRHLLSRFGRDTRADVLSLLNGSLNQGGVLFLGPTDTLDGLESAYQVVDQSWSIFKKTVPVRVSQPTQLPEKLTAIDDKQHHSSRQTLGVASEKAVISHAGRAYRALLDQYVPPGILINEKQDLLHVFGELPVVLTLKSGEVSSNLNSYFDASLCTLISTHIATVKNTRQYEKFSKKIEPDTDNEQLINFTILPICFDEAGDESYFLMTVENAQSYPIVNNNVQSSTENVNDKPKKQEEFSDETPLLDEERLSQLVLMQRTALGIWSWNFETGEQFWSDQFHKLLGYPDSTKNLTFDKTSNIHPADRPVLFDAFKAHFSKETEFSVECRLKLRSGHYAWFLIEGVAERTKQGKPMRMTGTARNVSGEHEIQNANDGWWDWRTQEDHQYMSPGFWAMLGIDSRNRSHGPGEWQEIIHPDDLKTSMENFVKHCETGGQYPYLQEVRYRHNQGHWITVIRRGRIVEWDDKGQPVRMVGVHYDITELKEQEKQLSRVNEQLARNNEDLEQFAYIASHDLKAPLRGITTLAGNLERDLAEVLTEESVNARHIKDYLQGLTRQASRMENLITGVLEYSRVESAGSNLVEVDVAELLLELALDYQLETGCQLLLETELPVVETDSVMLEQVFGNLLSNAVNFHPDIEALEIRVGCKTVGDHYEFYVADNGPGIGVEYHERIFEMFKTLPNTGHGDGTGIGLTLVKRIVEKFDGRVSIESAEGAGARFNFDWPIKSDIAL